MDKSTIENYEKNESLKVDISATLMAFMARDDANYISFLTRKLIAESSLKIPHKHTLIMGYFYGLDFNKEFEYPHDSQIIENAL